MKKNFIFLLAPIFIIGFAMTYGKSEQLRTSVDAGKKLSTTYYSDFQIWYKKTNRIVSPLPFISIHILDFLLVTAGIMFSAWFFLNYFSGEQK